MHLINTDFDLEGFWRHLVLSRQGVLLLDYDGTLAPFHPDPSKAVIYPALSKIMTRLCHQTSTRLIIISGRSVNDIRKLWPFDDTLEIWGSHGGERLYPDGRYVHESLGREESIVLERAAGWLVERGWKNRMETKPLSLAIHWRGVSEKLQKQLKKESLKTLSKMITHTRLSLVEFDGGMELRPLTITKAEAVDTILSEMDSSSAVAYLGDDFTDEDGFKAIKNRGLGALVRPKFRETNADIWLKPPEELLAFLEKWESMGHSSLSQTD